MIIRVFKAVESKSDFYDEICMRYYREIISRRYCFRAKFSKQFITFKEIFVQVDGCLRVEQSVTNTCNKLLPQSRTNLQLPYRFLNDDFILNNLF